MDAALDVVLEVFTWAGFGAAALLGILAVVLWAADGSWLTTRGVVEEADDGLLVRWFDDDGDADEAVPTDSEARSIGTATMVDLHYRHGWRGRMRLRRGSPAVRAVLRLAAGFASLGLLALVTGWILLFVRG